MSSIEGTAQQINLGSVLEDIERLEGVADEIAHGQATTGSVAGDLALKFCIQQDCYSQIVPVKQFWEEVDESIEQNHGQLMAACIDRVPFVGLLESDNEGLKIEGGRPKLPVSLVLSGSFDGVWSSVPTERLRLAGGYRKIEHDEHDQSYTHPSALIGRMSVGMASWYCALAFGDEAVKKFLGDEYRMSRSLNGNRFTVDPTSIYEDIQELAKNPL